MLHLMSTRARGGDRSAAPVPKSYITPDRAKKLRSELEQLWTRERPRVTQEVADAAAQGDRSENAEYIYGKKRLREIDRRIHFLHRRLGSSTVVDPTEQTEKNKVFFGATVTLEDEDGKRSTYQVVGPDETDTKGGRISMDSPVGKALLRKAKGDQVLVQRPRGEVELTIVEIRYL